MMDRMEYAVGRFTLQPFRQLLDAGQPVPVKRKALAILSVLAEAGGGPVSKDELMAAVWPNVNVEDNAIQAHVTALRKILGRDAELLCTLHGYGLRQRRKVHRWKPGLNRHLYRRQVRAGVCPLRISF